MLRLILEDEEIRALEDVAPALVDVLLPADDLEARSLEEELDVLFGLVDEGGAELEAGELVQPGDAVGWVVHGAEEGGFVDPGEEFLELGRGLLGHGGVSFGCLWVWLRLLRVVRWLSGARGGQAMVRCGWPLGVWWSGVVV